MSILGYKITKTISDTAWEASKTSFDSDGTQTTERFFIKKVDSYSQSLINLSKITLSRIYMSELQYDQGYLISEFVEGSSLKDIIESSNLDYNYILKYMMDIAEDVDYIHRNGIAHQNIKPSNIIYDSYLKKLRLIDFTHACAVDEPCEPSGEIVYTPPELVNGNQTISLEAAKAHDMWSVGVIFYQLANSGANYIDFTSTDPDVIAKDIQLLPVKASTNSYQLINQIIALLLNKTDRINSTQLVAAVPLIRPKCRVNDVDYTREEAESILLSLGESSSIVDLIDSDLCSMLSSDIGIYNLNGNLYTRKDLVKLAELLDIEISNSTDDLYQFLNKELDENLEFYQNKATADLLNVISIVAKGGDSSIFTERYGIYKANNLISSSMLEQFQRDIYSRYQNFKNMNLKSSAAIEAVKNNMIVNIIVSSAANMQEYKNMLV
jgi:serine/threonine protein kinase